MGQNFSSEPVVDKETGCAENETYKVAVSSCQGWRMSQEDNHSLMLELPQSQHKASFFAVYDGHGSARVSKHASEGLWCHLIRNPLYKEGNFKEALEQAFLSFDKEVNEKYTAQLAGTTAVCVLIVDNVIYCANIGDSRAVASVNCECEPLSHDHKPDNPEELRRILAAGGYVLGNRVNGNLALSRAFGDFHYKTNESLGPEDQIVSPFPDIKRIELNEDVDFILLACDGIWDVLTNEEVVKFVISRLEQNMEPSEICEQLTNRCIAPDYELVIGCDNMTVLLVCHIRGRSWPDYCTDIFNKNTKKLGVPRTRSFNPLDLIDETDVHRRGQQQLRQQQQNHLQQQQQQQLHEQEQENSGSANHMPFWARGTSGDGAEAGSQMSSNDDFASHIPRDIRMLLDAIQNLHTDDGPTFETTNNTSSHITEVSGEDDQNSRSNSSEVEHSQTGGQSVSESSEQQEPTTDLDDTSTNKTSEIHLDAPQDNDGDSEEKVVVDDGAQGESNDIVTKTVEIELEVPDEEVGEDVPDPLVDSNKEDLEEEKDNDETDGINVVSEETPTDGGEENGESDGNE